MKFKRCKSCGALVKVLKDCNCGGCGIVCCGESMEELIPNSTDAAVEKHVPELSVENGKLIAKVNHVMEDEHFIEWIAFENGDLEKIVHFKPGQVATAKFCIAEGTTVYAYCNKHGLWKKEM